MGITARMAMAVVALSIAPGCNDHRVTQRHAPEIVLTTKFVSDTELTAVIPATLLKDPIDAQLLVQNADIMGLSDGFEATRSQTQSVSAFCLLPFDSIATKVATLDPRE